MNREECLLKAADALEKSKKIEKRINWNNDADRDSQIGKRDKFLFDFFWYSVQANYQKGV